MKLELFRVCPRCEHKWFDASLWKDETSPLGRERRATWRGQVVVEVRRHDKCGGQMCSTGVPAKIPVRVIDVQFG